MKTVIPHYYTQFRCIADRCVHSCCIGWEIDVDADTLARYRTVGGALGKRLAAQIVDGAFVLYAQERCPFLNAQGLCDIITELGEDALCEICAEHPRFRSFYSDREEIGLGLCCEEAARMVLTQTPPASFIETGSEQPTPEEQAFFAFRKRLLSVVQDRSQPLSARLQAALDIPRAGTAGRELDTTAGRAAVAATAACAGMGRAVRATGGLFPVPSSTRCAGGRPLGRACRLCGAQHAGVAVAVRRR